ncbi:MAG: hypothetical protein GC184_03965 [Rhizobiales bacterium]|nr:hypothetical protein [Hyphomicrobiales bacterium]
MTHPDTSRPAPHNVHFIIGAMKAGTTALYNSLVLHPDVCPCADKEPGIFSCEEIAPGEIDTYLDRWTEWAPGRHRIAIDASTHYTKAPIFPDAAEKIHAFNPGARLIYLVRNPYDRIRSQYQMSIVKGWAITPLSEHVDEHALTVSQYYYQLALYRRHFSKDQILVLAAEQLKAHPNETFREVLQHLDIDDNVPLEPRQSHESDKLYLLPYIRALLNAAGNEISKAPADVLTRFVNAMPDDRRVALLKAAATLYTLTPANLSQIHDALKDDMKQLHHEYGIDVKAWGFDV